jgi:hypothetical protein
MSDNPRIDEIRESVRNSYEEVTRMLDGDLATLDPDKLYRSPDGSEWTIMENLAHITEIMPYWGNEAAKLVAAPGQKFGRTMEDANRLKAISDHGADRLNQVKAALPGSYSQLDEVLSKLKDSDLALTGVHSKFGEKPLDWFIHEFITNHLKNHLNQLRSCLNVVK